MSRSIFDPTGPNTEHSGPNRSLGPDAQNISHMPADVVDGKVSEEEVAEHDAAERESAKREAEQRGAAERGAEERAAEEPPQSELDDAPSTPENDQEL